MRPEEAQTRRQLPAGGDRREVVIAGEAALEARRTAAIHSGPSRFVRVDREENLTPTATGEASIALRTPSIGLSHARRCEGPSGELDNIVRRAQSFKFDLEFIVSCDQPDFVYWCEKRAGAFLSTRRQ